MKIINMFKSGKTLLSFEIFPPKPAFPVETIFGTLDGLKELEPDFVSVTYGAGGSSSVRTLEIAARIKNDYRLETLTHLTCVGATRGDIDEVLDCLERSNIDNILALRGDPPAGATEFVQHSGGYKYARDLISHVGERKGFCVAAAAYPEGHMECGDLDRDISYLKMKVDYGASFLITQLFFDNVLYYRFLEKARRAGIQCPISVGIFPVLNTAQVKRITALCGAAIPESLQRIMDKYGDNPTDMEKAGLDYACEQIANLVANHVEGIHLYTMNKAEQAKFITQQTGLR